MSSTARATRLSIPLLVTFCFWVVGGGGRVAGWIAGGFDGRPSSGSLSRPLKQSWGLPGWLEQSSGSIASTGAVSPRRPAPTGCGSGRAAHARTSRAPRFLRGSGGFLLALARAPDA